MVTLRGHGFVYSSRLACRMGLYNVGASFVSATEVTCIVPGGLSPGTVRVSVSNNGVDLSSNALEWVGHADTVVLRVDPAVGAVSGGDVVRVTGTGFEDNPQLRCRFGHATRRAPAVFISSTEIRCETAAHPAGAAQVDVTTNNVDFTDSGVQFHFVEDAVLTSLSPSRGSAAGGTSVLVSGRGFVDSGALACHF